MMKYERPIMEVMIFENSDVITSSSELSNPLNDPNNTSDWSEWQNI